MLSTELSHWPARNRPWSLTTLRDDWQRRHLAAAVAAACIGLALTAGTWYAAVNREDRLAEEDLKARANNQALLIQSGIRLYVGKLAALHALFASDDNVPREEFQAFSNSLLQDQTAILAVSWLPRVPHDQLAAHEREGVAQGLIGYHVKSAASDGSLVPGARRRPNTFRYSIPPRSHSAPRSMVLTSRTAAFGNRRSIVRVQRRIATSETFLLRSGEGDRTGFFMAMPVFRRGAPHDSIESRNEQPHRIRAGRIPNRGFDRNDPQGRLCPGGTGSLFLRFDAVRRSAADLFSSVAQQDERNSSVAASGCRGGSALLRTHHRGRPSMDRGCLAHSWRSGNAQPFRLLGCARCGLVRDRTGHRLYLVARPLRAAHSSCEQATRRAECAVWNGRFEHVARSLDVQFRGPADDAQSPVRRDVRAPARRHEAGLQSARPLEAPAADRSRCRAKTPIATLKVCWRRSGRENRSSG